MSTLMELNSILNIVISSDLSVDILTSWLCIEDVSRLDIAICSRDQRKDFLYAISSEVELAVFDGFKKYNSGFLIWLDIRRVYINRFILPDMLNESSITHFKTLMERTGHLITEVHTVDSVDYARITDTTIVRIAYNCPSLQSLSLNSCFNITDTAIIKISENCLSLQSLSLNCCYNITDTAIIRIAENCLLLQSFAY